MCVNNSHRGPQRKFTCTHMCTNKVGKLQKSICVETCGIIQFFYMTLWCKCYLCTQMIKCVIENHITYIRHMDYRIIKYYSLQLTNLTHSVK